MTPAQRRRLQRQLEVQEEACRLVTERGYDGFTMDDLAEAVGVSRRTLFNLVADKESSVLGPLNEEDKQELIREFGDRPTTGTPIRDAINFVQQMLQRFQDDDPDGVERHHAIERAATSDPKVRQLLIARFAMITQTAADAIGTQQKWPPNDLRARVAASVLLSLIQQALQEQAVREEPPTLADLFGEILAAAAEAGIQI